MRVADSREWPCMVLLPRYNAENGVPSCANTDLLTTKARLEWGFEGCVHAP